MAKRYAIWDKQSSIITPTFHIFTAEEWKERYPIARLDNSVIICSGGEINGGFFGTLAQLMHVAEVEGVDFSHCTTDEEKLDLYDAWENEKNTPKNIVNNEELTAVSLASIAASMEYQNMLTLDDVEGV